MIPTAGAMAASVLQEVADNLIETVSRMLDRFSSNAESARRVALETDACRGASFAIRRYATATGPLREYTGLYFGQRESESEFAADAASAADNVLQAAKECERVLAQATARAPDLLQFLPFRNSEAHVASPTEALGEADEPQSPALTSSGSA